MEHLGRKRYKTYLRQKAKWQKPFLIRNYFKCKQIKLSNLTVEIGRID